MAYNYVLLCLYPSSAGWGDWGKDALKNVMAVCNIQFASLD
jgi:hypothetical protein